MRFINISFYVWLLLLSVYVKGQEAVKPEKMFAVEELKSDLLFYKSKLEKLHPNLYPYSAKQQVDQLFDSLAGLIQKPLTDLEFYQIVSLTVSVVKDGHTIILPDLSTREFHHLHNKLLPYQLALAGSEFFVRTT